MAIPAMACLQKRERHLLFRCPSPTCKNVEPPLTPTSILDPNYVIGVWASASRQQIRTLNANGTESHSGNWVQVSRLGMPLTNEVVIPVGMKDYWNSLTPYQEMADHPTGSIFLQSGIGAVHGR